MPRFRGASTGSRARRWRTRHASWMLTWKERVGFNGGVKDEDAALRRVQLVSIVVVLVLIGVLAADVLGSAVPGRLVLVVDDEAIAASLGSEGPPFNIADASSMACASWRSCAARKDAVADLSSRSFSLPSFSTSAKQSAAKSTACVSKPLSVTNGARWIGCAGLMEMLRGAMVRSLVWMVPLTMRAPTRVTWPFTSSARGVLRTRVLPGSMGARSA